MILINTKLTLLVLALPIISMVLAFVTGFYFYRESFDASAFSTAVSSLLSAIVVVLLVWERLRDSLFKKLEYLHEDFFRKLYMDFRDLKLYWNQDEIKRLRVDLDKYGKFMNLSVYPRGFLNNLDEFLSVHSQFYERLEKIGELASGQWNSANYSSYRTAILDYLGLTDYLGLKQIHRSQYPDEVEKKCKQIAQTIEKENHQLVTETKGFFEKTNELGSRIFRELEEFLKSNNLRCE